MFDIVASYDLDCYSSNDRRLPAFVADAWSLLLAGSAGRGVTKGNKAVYIPQKTA